MDRRTSTGDVAAQQTRCSNIIRSRGFTGAKEGCAEGECGACAVLFVKRQRSRDRLSPVNSCLIPLPSAAGQEVYTVEALADNGRLAAVQAAMAAGGGSQCGYCTPGFVVSMFAEQYRRDRRPADRTCSGRQSLPLHRLPAHSRRTCVSLGPPPDGRFRGGSSSAGARAGLCTTRPQAGRFSRPVHACRMLSTRRGGSVRAQFVAGNTDLGVITNLRDRAISASDQPRRLPELREFRDGAGRGRNRRGAHADRNRRAMGQRRRRTIFDEWLQLFASPLIRNRATLGGNLATASPIGDSAPLLLALDAEVRIAGPRGERMFRSTRSFTAIASTALASGESSACPCGFPSRCRIERASTKSRSAVSTTSAPWRRASRSGVDRIGTCGLGGSRGAGPRRVCVATRAP